MPPPKPNSPATTPTVSPTSNASPASSAPLTASSPTSSPSPPPASTTSSSKSWTPATRRPSASSPARSYHALLTHYCHPQTANLDAARSIASTRNRKDLPMKVLFVAGFGPILRDEAATTAFYRDTLGLPFNDSADGYYHSEHVPGTKAF